MSENLRFPLWSLSLSGNVISLFRFRDILEEKPDKKLSMTRFPGGSPGRGQRNAVCLTWLRSAKRRSGPAPCKGGDPAAGSPTATLLRLHPSHRHLLGRLAAASVDAGFHDVTGGVYKARERIQGTVADVPLLAIPTSCSRVADCSPNWGRLWGSAGRRRLASHCTGHCSTFAAPGVRAIRT